MEEDHRGLGVGGGWGGFQTLVYDPKLSAGRGVEYSAAAQAGDEEVGALDDAVPVHYYPEGVETVSASTNRALDASNKGYQLLQRLGWRGKGLGRNEHGMTEPISAGVDAGVRLGLGKQAEDDHYTAAENISRKKLEVEIQADETSERKERREAQALREQQIKEDVSQIKKTFYCQVCSKQYQTAMELEEHLSSYDHHHKKRLAEARAAELERTRDERARKEQKRQLREQQRLEEQIRRAQAAAGVTQAQPRSAQPIPPPPLPPPLPQDDAPAAGGWGWSSAAPAAAAAAPPPPPPEDSDGGGGWGSSGWAAAAAPPPLPAPAAGGWSSAPLASQAAAAAAAVQQQAAAAVPPPPPPPPPGGAMLAGATPAGLGAGKAGMTLSLKAGGPVLAGRGPGRGVVGAAGRRPGVLGRGAAGLGPRGFGAAGRKPAAVAAVGMFGESSSEDEAS